MHYEARCQCAYMRIEQTKIQCKLDITNTSVTNKETPLFVDMITIKQFDHS